MTQTFVHMLPRNPSSAIVSVEKAALEMPAMLDQKPQVFTRSLTPYAPGTVGNHMAMQLLHAVVLGWIVMPRFPPLSVWMHGCMHPQDPQYCSFSVLDQNDQGDIERSYVFAFHTALLLLSITT